MTGSLEMILVDGGILSGVIAAFILSLRMMITAKTRKSLQFQLAAWLVIWTVSEMWRYLGTVGAVSFSEPLLLLGMGIHTVSMLAFAAFISIRFSKFIRR
jgi:apolipoprotein N-acyltransferase